MTDSQINIELTTPNVSVELEKQKDIVIQTEIQEIGIQIEKPEINITTETPQITLEFGIGGEKGVGITNIEDNGDGTFTRTYGDGSTKFTTSDLRGPAGAGSTISIPFNTALYQWDITHPLSMQPIITCYDEHNQIIRPDAVHYLSNSLVQVIRLIPQRGRATLTV